jgi:hypothetical protein
MGYLSKTLSAVSAISTIPFASPQTNALTRPIVDLEGVIRICDKGGVKLCQTNHTHYLWDGELYDYSGEKIILNKDGAPIASGRWSYRGLENQANNCFKEGVKECYTNHTHYLLDDELFLKNPDGKFVKVSHPSEQPKAEASSNKIFLKEGLKGNVAKCEKAPGVQRCENNGSHFLVDDKLYLIDPKNPKIGHLIPDAPAKLPSEYNPFEVEKFLTCFTSIALGATSLIYLVAHNLEQDAIPYNNYVYNQVFAQLTFAVGAAAITPQSNPSNIPGDIVKTDNNNNPNSNSIKTLSLPKKLSELTSSPRYV